MKQKSFFLLAMLLVAFAGNAQTGKDLDINDDGAVDLSDVSILINYILNPPEPSGNQTFTVKGVNFDMIAVEVNGMVGALLIGTQCGASIPRNC